ncbi:MAG TPA: alpha/beta hydrolase [Stellaceae bacterium]|nr:alpha/beta hydrolase [Stellaceae bacterium]
MWWTVALVVLAYLLAIATLYLAQRRLLFVPGRERPLAISAGLARLREIEIETDDGLRLLSWYLPPRAAGAPVVLYLHGNGGTVADRSTRLHRFAAAGLGALFVEYRGYGGNPGVPSETGLIADGRAALAFLRREGHAARAIALYGESLGTGVAVALASRDEVGALLLEAPFTSIAALARRRFPWVPVGLLLRDPFDSLHRIGAVRAPILVMLGERDRVVTPASSRALFAAAPEPKELWCAPAGGHNDLAEFGAIDAAVAFIARLAEMPPTRRAKASEPA